MVPILVEDRVDGCRRTRAREAPQMKAISSAVLAVWRQRFPAEGGL